MPGCGSAGTEGRADSEIMSLCDAPSILVAGSGHGHAKSIAGGSQVSDSLSTGRGGLGP